MPEPRSLLKAKAQGFILSIKDMGEGQLKGNPSGEMGNDYNTLRELVGNKFPDLAAYLPPKVTVFRGANAETTYTRQSLGEIKTFCEQLYQLLSAE